MMQVRHGDIGHKYCHGQSQKLWIGKGSQGMSCLGRKKWGGERGMPVLLLTRWSITSFFKLESRLSFFLLTDA